MDLSETELPPVGREVKIIEALALALDIAIILYDRNDKLIAVSPQIRRFINIPPDMIVPGARLRDLLGASYDAGVNYFGSINGKIRITSREDWIAERIATHWRERHESTEQLADGRWVRLCKRRMPDGVLVSTIEDVSEQVRRDAELSETRQHAELAQHILNNLANPVVVKNSSLRYVAVNEAFCRIRGLRPQQIIGRPAKDLVKPKLALEFEAIERKVLETGVPFEAAQDIIRRDGSIMHAVTRVHRSGKQGNYYITISFDDVADYVAPVDRDTDVRARTGHLKPETSVEAEEPKRILVLETDTSRGQNRVAALKAAGFDALMISQATEVFAFLAQAERMQIRIDEIELCDAMGRELISHQETVRHPALANALKTWSAAAAKKQTISAGRSEPETVAAQPKSESEMQTVPEARQRAPAVVELAVSEEAAPGTHRSSASNKAPKRLRILVAEDNHVNQIVFEQILEGIDADYRIVSNGEEALAAWQSSAPDLILMDVSMPVMNGLQATQEIRKAEAERPGGEAHTPIIAVTAHAMGGDRERCFDAGMDDYLSKPVSPDKLEAIIARWVGTVPLDTADGGAY